MTGSRAAASAAKKIPRLHAVTDDAIAGLANIDKLAAAIAQPGVALHARAPSADGRRHFDLASSLGAAARDAGAILIVNDRVDVALAAAAQGVHLPARGLPLGATRSLVGGDLLIGCSAHSPDDARRAVDQGADYVFLGPIWETASHPGRPGLGPLALKGLPGNVVAIGGVTTSRVRECMEAGAWGVAVVSALWRAGDASAATAEMLISLGQ